MARPGFFNDNSYRDYPFLPRTHGRHTDSSITDLSYLPHSVVVDFSCVIGFGAQFDPTVHTVYLDEIVVGIGRYEFVFRSDAPGLAGMALRFHREYTDGVEYASEFAEGSYDESESSDSSDSGCEGQPRISGYLVTGDLEALYLQTTNGQTLSGHLPVEPATVVDLQNQWVRSVSLANQDRTRSEPPTGCRDYCWPYDINQIRSSGTCLGNLLRFRPGFNCQIDVSAQQNQIKIAASLGAGLGQPCEEVELFDGEVPPADSNLLSGGPSCRDLIRSLNGQGGPELSIGTRDGLTAYPYPAEHKIVIDLDFHNLPITCSQDSSDCGDLDTNADPCECGDSL